MKIKSLWKHAICFLFLLGLVVLPVACGGDDPEPPPVVMQPEPKPTPTTDPNNNNNNNESDDDAREFEAVTPNLNDGSFDFENQGNPFLAGEKISPSNEGGNWGIFGNGSNAADSDFLTVEYADNPSKSGINTSDRVLKITEQAGNAPWSGFFFDLEEVVVFPDGMNAISVHIYSIEPGQEVEVKIEDATDNTKNVVSKVKTTKNDEWEQLIFNFASENSGLYDRIAMVMNHAKTNDAETTYYLDNVAFATPKEVTDDGGGGDTDSGTEATAPDGPAPIPSLEAENVLSVFSDAYTNIENVDFNPDWGQQTTQTFEDVADGDRVLKYENLNYQGIEFKNEASDGNTPVDVSSYHSVHLDYWVSNSTKLQFFLINSALQTGSNPAEKPSELEVSKVSQWVSVDIPLSHFSDVVDLAIIDQFKFDGDGTVYVDNLYFHGEGDHASPPPSPTDAVNPLMEAPSNPQHPADMVTSIFSDGYDDVEGVNLNPDWGQATQHDGDFNIDGNEILKYTNLNYQGIQFATEEAGLDVSKMTHLHVDYYVVRAVDLRLYLISPGPKEKAVSLDVSQKGRWISLDIPLEDFTKGDSAVDLTEVFQFKIDEEMGMGSGAEIYLDNLYFHMGNDVFNDPAAHLDCTFETIHPLNLNDGPIDFECRGNPFVLVNPEGTEQDTWTRFGGNPDPPSITLAYVENPDKSDINLSNYVLQFTEQPGNQPWAGIYFDLEEPIVFPAHRNAISMQVYSQAPGQKVTLKLEKTAQDFKEETVPTTASNQWEELKFEFSSSDSNQFTRLVLFMHLGQSLEKEQITYLDNIKIVEGGNQESMIRKPDQPAPYPQHTENTLAIFNDNPYENLQDTEFNPDWHQQTQMSKERISGDQVLKYANLDFQPTALGQVTDVSSHSHIHLDYWTADASKLEFKILSLGVAREDAIAYSLPLNRKSQWVQRDIPLSYFAESIDLTKVAQIVLEGDGTVYLDNIYFHGTSLSPQESAPEPTLSPEEVSSIFSDPYGRRDPITGLLIDGAYPTVPELITPFGEEDQMLKHSNIASQAIQINPSLDASDKAHFHLDYWVATSTKLKFSILSVLDDVTHEVSYELDVSQKEQWIRVDIPLEDFKTETGTMDWKLINQFKIEGDGTTYFDNLYFYGRAQDDTMGMDPPCEFETVTPNLNDGSFDFECQGPSFSASDQNVGEGGTWGRFGPGSNAPESDFLTLEYVDNPNQSGINTSDRVLKITEQAGNEPWSGFFFELEEKIIFPSGMNAISIQVWSKEPGQRMELKLEELGNPQNNENSTVTTTETEAWENLIFEFSESNSGEFNQMVMVMNHAQTNSAQVSYHIDHIALTSPEGTVDSGSSQEPSQAAPNPTRSAEDVISIFSDAYTDVENVQFNPQWGQSTTVTRPTLSGNEVLKYENLNYQGIEFRNQADNGNTPIDVSSYAGVHLDYWVSNSSRFSIDLINSALQTGGEAVEKLRELDVSKVNQWVAVDIPLSDFSDVVDLSKVDQLKFEGDNTVYIDNIYFYKE
ncbi:MAG: hypothetical protein OXC92_09930 [Flavobacteriaceae bacterium]|nr:hypothetical protein [Flavobacteriaceae bacterium]